MNETIKFIFIFTLISVLVFVIANIEMIINKNIAVYSGELTKNIQMISSNKTGLNDPIWIFNSKYVHMKDIQFPFKYHKSDFVKEPIEEHLASKINRPFFEFINHLKKSFKSTMPINNLYKTLSKGEEAIYVVDPGTGMNETKYKILHSKRDNNIETFISNDKIYILHH